ITIATRSPGERPSPRPAAAAATRAANASQVECTRSPSAIAGASGRRRPLRATQTAGVIAVPSHAMRLDEDEARAGLAAYDHGVLSTVHPERGVDAVPCVYAVDGDLVGIPIDRVKPKASTRLQRERNLEADPRATLLVDHWDRDDWTRLWWVRAELRFQPGR